MGRDVPFKVNATCDGCGATGAYDFMGDYFCQDCCDKFEAEAALEADEFVPLEEVKRDLSQ